MAIKLMPKWVSKSNSKLLRGGGGGRGNNDNKNNCKTSEIKWERRPGGMLVQTRETRASKAEIIRIRVSIWSCLHEISIDATSTFGELKEVVFLVSGLKPWEQRLLFKGKEREDNDHLHMFGIKDMDKVVVLEDPAMREWKKLHGMELSTCYTTTTAL